MYSTSTELESEEEFDTVRLAGRVSSRCSAFTNQFSDDIGSTKVLDAIQTLRRNFLNHCKRKLKSSFPKVTLKRTTTGNVTRESVRHRRLSLEENYKIAKNGLLPDIHQQISKEKHQILTGDEDQEVAKTSEPDVCYSEVVINMDQIEVNCEDDDDNNQPWFPINSATSLNEKILEDPLVTEPERSMRSLLKCPQCTMTFTNEDRLGVHMKLHDDFDMETESESLGADVGEVLIVNSEQRKITTNKFSGISNTNRSIPGLNNLSEQNAVQATVATSPLYSSETDAREKVGECNFTSVNGSCSLNTQPNPKTVYKCTPCDMHFNACNLFLHHMFWTHGRVFRIKSTSMSAIESSSGVPTNDLYVCPEVQCNVRRQTKEKLIKHIWTHTKEKGANSSQVPNSSTTILNWGNLGFQPQPQNGAVVNDVAPSVTPSESQSFGSASQVLYASFYHHRSEESGDCHYVCSNCPFQTMNSTELHDHVKSHLESWTVVPNAKTRNFAKPSGCKLPPSSSSPSSSSSFVKNSLSVTTSSIAKDNQAVSQRPRKQRYICDFEECTKSYVLRRHLTAHRLTHTWKKTILLPMERMPIEVYKTL